MRFELTWRILLLGAVLAADLLAFLNLVAKELRELRADRRLAQGQSEPSQRIPNPAHTRVGASFRM